MRLFSFSHYMFYWRYERKVAAAFFAEPPSATFEEAFEYALTAEKLTTTDWKENKLLVAKCEIALGRYHDAIETLLKADEMHNDGCMVSDKTVYLICNLTGKKF